MKNQLTRFLSFFFFIVFSTIGLSQDILWEKSSGGKHADYLMDAQPTSDYGFILAGSSLSKKTGNKTLGNNGDLDYWVWKMNENGDLEWQRNFGGSGADFLQSVALTTDGGFILAGNSSSNKGFDKFEDSKGKNDFWIIKLNANGGEEWQRTIGGVGQELLQLILQTRDGGYILGGSSSSDKSGDKTDDSFGSLDYWIIKLDYKGKIIWQKTYGGIYADELRSIEQTADGGYIVGGNSNSPTSTTKSNENIGLGDYWILKLDNKGEIIWQKTIGGKQDDQLVVIHQTYDKGYIIGGNSNSENSNDKNRGNQNGTDYWVVKLNEEGIILWQETYNFGNVDVLTSLIENHDHSFLIGGYAVSELANNNLKSKESKGINDYIAIKINEKGQEIWSKSVGSDGEDILKKVIETRDGGYVFAGTSNPQALPLASAQQKSKGMLSGVSSNGQNEEAQDVKNDLNKEITNTSNEVNETIKNTASDATNKVNDGLGNDKDSPFKLGGNDSSSPLNLSKIGEGKEGSNPLSGLNSNTVLPASREKMKSFGSNDFWVVKIKDKEKPDKVKLIIEASPNPTSEFTNVIVGYDFETGTATVADLAGHLLQRFEITSRTVPIDLSAYPEGIYVVNIKTNVQSDGVKIIKGINKK